MPQLSVLIADDSPTVRVALTAILEVDPEITVVATAINGRQAVELAAQHQPDVITMDIDMPGLDGLQATKQIMRTAPRPIVIVSAHVDDAVQTSLDALRTGAVAVLGKPPAPGAPGYSGYCRELVLTVKAVADVKLVQHRDVRRELAPKSAKSAQAIAIATSTGGPQALEQVLGSLPVNLPVPVLVVQHISVGFVAGLAQWLQRRTPPTVKLAEDGERLAAGVVYLAPDDHHLTVTAAPHRIALVDSAPEGGFRPSANALFRSLADSYGKSCACAILTGMGRDGVDGLRSVHAAGGLVIAQDKESSTVFGMNGEAIAAGLTDVVLPLSQIGHQLLTAVSTRSRP